MKILIDARKYYDFGIGTYIQNILPSIAKQCELSIILSPKDYDKVNIDLSVQKYVDISKKYSVGELFSISKTANKLQPHVFHAPHYTVPFGLKVPCVVTIHDILHLKGRKYFSTHKRLYAKLIIKHACNVSKIIIVDSEFTKNEIIETFKIKSEKIKVVHLGVSDIFLNNYLSQDIDDFKTKYNFSSNTILYTGSLKPHKNVKTLIYAFEKLSKKEDVKLAFVGESIKQNKYLWNYIIEKQLQNKIIDIGRIATKELPLAYHASSVVVLPSFYEGFGFSVLEAMACGIPAIGAMAGSIPEVMGNAGILFDPNSVNELTDALENVLTNTELKDKMIKSGYENIKRFSWQKCAEQTLEIYKEAV